MKGPIGQDAIWAPQYSGTAVAMVLYFEFATRSKKLLVAEAMKFPPLTVGPSTCMPAPAIPRSTPPRHMASLPSRSLTSSTDEALSPIAPERRPR